MNPYVCELKILLEAIKKSQPLGFGDVFKRHVVTSKELKPVTTVYLLRIRA